MNTHNIVVKIFRAIYAAFIPKVHTVCYKVWHPFCAKYAPLAYHSHH